MGVVGSIGTLGIERGRYLSHQIQALEDKERDFAVVGGTSLGERAAAKGLIYGAATQQQLLSSDLEFANRFAQECKLLITEGDLLWKEIRPSPDRFDFTVGDRLAEFARTHGMLLAGGHLVWYNNLPDWFKETVNRRNAEQFLVKHIKRVVGHYAGQMHFWTVVNEAIEPPDGQPNGLRKVPWLEFLGVDYIDLAFRVAAEADPKALLVYNDYGLDYDRPADEGRRTALLRLLERLKSKGTPIHALGIQAHLTGSETRFNPKKLRDFLSNVAALGLKIIITEMDVIDQGLPLNVVARDRIIARAYEDYLTVALDELAVSTVLTWGLSDRYTWLSWFRPRYDGSQVRPLPLDANLKPKLAWNAIARAFDKAPMREVQRPR
jgi:endo-1,4-beta-xylanase